MLQEYTPITKLTPAELREYHTRSQHLTEGQNAIILSTGRAVKVVNEFRNQTQQQKVQILKG